MQKNNKIDKLLLSGLLSSLFYSMSSPTIHMITVQAITDSRFVSLKNLISCVLIVITANLCIKKEQYLYQHYQKILIAESILYGMLVMAMFFCELNVLAFYIIDTILYATITRCVICTSATLKAKRYDKNTRSVYDNTVDIYCNVACAIGYTIASIIEISLNTSLILMFLGISVDNILYMSAYKETQK